MSSAVDAHRKNRQATITEFRPARTPALSHPTMHGPTVRQYSRHAPKLPYDVPTRGSTDVARSKHRTYYWLVNDYWSYECPDCGRGHDRVYTFDVHHIDENPRNGDPENLIGLCRRCHAWRHAEEPTIAGLDVHEWKSEFLKVSQ